MTYEVGRCLLQKILDKRKMSQSELSRRLKVKPQQIQHYIKGNRVMTLKTAKNISMVLDCDINDLYEWNEVGNNE